MMYIFFLKKGANLQVSYEGIKIGVAKKNQVHCVISDWCF